MREKLAPHIRKIIASLQEGGYETYLVGGAVRDILLGIRPKDHDISTSATPEQIRTLFGRRNVRIIGKRFRLAHFYHGREIIEISTFRKDPGHPPAGEEADGDGVGDGESFVRYDNEFGTATEDAFRRDFTVNAIFFDPVRNKVVDFTGAGVKDLEQGVVRCIGEPAARFQEDPVRILRCFKLAGQYGFRPTPETEEAAISSSHLVQKCSHSRLSLELQKFIQKPHSHKILASFHRHGFLAHYLPFLHAAWGGPDCEYMLQLLEERNSRIIKGLYRDSLSVAIAAAVIPFAESELGPRTESACLWNYYQGIEGELRDIIFKVFSPCHFPKFASGTAITILMLQPSLYNKIRRKNVMSNHRFFNARELMTIQNNSRWNDPTLEEFWAGGNPHQQDL